MDNREKKEILLIYPALRSVKQRLIPPYSVWILASVLTKSGYKPVIVDQRISPAKQFLENIKNHININTLFIGISCTMESQFDFAEKNFHRIRQFSGDIPIVFGGTYISQFSNPNLQQKLLNINANDVIICIGPGIHTITGIARYYEKRIGINKVRGIKYFHQKYGLIENEKRKFPRYMPRLDNTVIDINKYVYFDEGRKTFDLYTSFGCLMGCKFCINSLYNFWASMEKRHILDQILFLHKKLGVEYFRIIDDNPLQKPDRIINLFRALDKKKLDIKFYMDIATPYILEDWFADIAPKLLKVFVGIESGSDRILKIINKPQRIRDIKKAIKKLAGFRIKARYSFIKEMDIESALDINKTADLIKWIRYNHKDAEITIKRYKPPHCLQSLSLR